MSEQPQHLGTGDERMKGTIGNLLRMGVIASALIVLSGGMLYLIRDGRKPAPDLRNFHQQPAQLRNPLHILREAVSLRALGLIMLGLLLLIATPVVRVIYSVTAFAFRRDYQYLLFTLLVLTVLLFSLLSGKVGR